MTAVPLGIGAYIRSYGRMPEIVMENRFFETSPANQIDGVALLSRPGTTYETTHGSGPIRANYTQKDLFESALFTVSDTTLYYRETDGTDNTISGSVPNSGVPRMAGVSGAAYQRLFIVDGTTTQYYGGAQYQSVLTYTAGAISDDVVVIDGVYYQFTSSSVDAGTPAGTMASPWLVDSSGTAAQSLANLRYAINQDTTSGTPGTSYSTNLTANLNVESNANTATTLTARSRTGGAPVSSIAVSVTATGGADGLAWSSPTLVAGPDVLYGIATPDDRGFIDLAVINGYILFVEGGTQRVYYLEPGEVEFDPLNFFEAESEPDNLVGIVVVGDKIWLLGKSSIDVYYPTGDANAPFLRVEGEPFSVGALQGTVVKINNVTMFVGSNNVIYKIDGGLQPVGTPFMSERVRIALEQERLNT